MRIIHCVVASSYNVKFHEQTFFVNTVHCYRLQAYKFMYMYIVKDLGFQFLNQHFKTGFSYFPYLRKCPFYCNKQQNYFQMNFFMWKFNYSHFNGLFWK